MGAGFGRRIDKASRWRLLAGVSALASACVLTPVASPAVAQTVSPTGAGISATADLLLQGDTLVYDNDRNTITVVGGVQIDYDGNRLVAQRLTYDRNTSRLVASGGVELFDRDGTRIQADSIDVTDDFRDGFVRALRVETVDRTFIAAESADRRDGAVTTFNRGVYTACEPCEERPDKAPIWRVRAQKIIWNGEAKVIRFERARLEFFGFPIAFLPAFEVADPTVKRKSGFLSPSFKGSDTLGYGLTVPYYLALAPTYDVTLFATGYTKQGFLGEAEWRQRFNNGAYSVRIAGINQRDPNAFGANTEDRNRLRGMIGTKGEFQINPRWTFGWDILAQTDKNFSRTYSVNGFNALTRASQVYLRGINDRNFFDLRGYRFEYQEATSDFLASGAANLSARSPRQPWVLPSFDYSITPNTPVAGGELNIDVNVQGVFRSRFDGRGFFPDDNELTGQTSPLVRGVDGTSVRATAEAEWKRTVIAPGGLALTPILHARTDAIGTNYSSLSAARIAAVATSQSAQSDIRSAYYRYMATAGLEARWPVLFSTTSSTHILEPMAQLFARPNAPYGTSLGIPNEDAQSLVFDASSLFERDKFSGYDRIEGGVRANLGIRYSGTFGAGWTANAIFGQSFHLAGVNPFASPDLVYAGAFSGLETNRSDYVAQIGVTSPIGVSLSAGGRFDESTFAMRRADVTASYASTPLSVVGNYTFIEAQPDYGFSRDRHTVRLSASSRFHENWRVFGSGTYDIVESTLVSRSIGFAYDDECFDYSLFVSETQATRSAQVNRTFGFKVELRTLGEFGADSRSVFN